MAHVIYFSYKSLSFAHNINTILMVHSRDRTGSVTGPERGRSRTRSDRRRSNFWTGAGPLFAFLRCACIKADNVETVKP